MVSLRLHFLILAVLFGAPTATLAKETLAYPPGSLKVCVYYDTVKDKPQYKLGEIYSIMTRNLLAHFREVKADARLALDYKAGDLETCQRVIYIGSYYEAPVGEGFYEALGNATKPVLWINYGIWQLQKRLGVAEFEKRTGFTFTQLVGWASKPSEDNKSPAFYRYFYYKGQRFEKLSLWDAVKKQVAASPEIAQVRATKATVLAEAEHSETQNRTPYILTNGQFYYVADIPFAFLHEADRYLIFCDLLFDFLGLPPRQTKKYALARIEDIHPEFNLPLLYETFGVFKRRQIPFAISVIPKYSDFFSYKTGGPWVENIDRRPLFVKAIKYAIANGGRVLMHGYTHQISEFLDCDTSASGDDYEFWDGCHSEPLKFETKEWVLDRLNRGSDLLRKVGIEPVGWVPPHYEASPLGYRLFASFFDRTVQRVRYQPAEFDPQDKINWAGQFFPYTIYGDVYGQYIWPENLGNVRLRQPGIPDFHTRTTAQIIQAARLNSVIRDSWASFFWHPQLIYTTEALKSLETIVDEISKLGYEFVDLAKLKNEEMGVP